MGSGACDPSRRFAHFGARVRQPAVLAHGVGHHPSLRFGTSLGEVLEQSAEQARAARKAQVEERVVKAPVKMMIPTGTLILPAMLLLVLGPVLLELMEGM